MKIFLFSDSIIGSDRIDLIPYSSEHVDEYNKWLQCPEMQELTETEPCSLEDEYIFQKEWELDNQQRKLIKLIRSKADGKLIGDVNLFFQDEGIVEINLMISNAEYRGKGIAKEVLDLLFVYIKSSGRDFRKVIAKVLSKNGASIRFFEKYGFKRVGEETIFSEIILIFDLT